METQLEFHQMYEYTRLVEPLVVTTNKEFHNQGFIQGLHDPVHTTLHAGADRTVDTKPGGINHIMRDEGSIKLTERREPTFRGNHSNEKHS